MSLDENFQKAANDVKNLKNTPPDAELLQLYALYKQATVGPNNTEKPGLLSFQAKAKWEAWNDKKEMSSDAAKQEYIAFVEKLIGTHGLK